VRVRLALALLLLPALASAQARQPAPGGPREEVFRMVDAYIVSNLQDALGLSDDQFSHLVPLVKHLQNDRRELTQRRQAMMRELRGMFQAGTATEARVADVLKDVKALDADMPATLKRDLDAIDAGLTPVQQAKYRVLEFNVDQRIRGLMTRWVQQEQKERPGARQPLPSPQP
jgi:hypothetical protein